MSRWRRPVTKTYDYNFKLGEHYYKPQLDYLETRKGRGISPPTAKSFAERFVDDPIYGRNGGVSLSRRAGDEYGTLDKSKYGSLDDLNFGKKASSLFSAGENLDSLMTSNVSGSYSPRLIVGDRLLDSVGVKESRLSANLNLNSSSLSSSSKLQNQSDEQSSSSTLLSRRKVGFMQSAEADLNREDPFKSRGSSKLQAARKQADDMMDEMKRDADSSTSRFRARAQARKEEQSQRREQQQLQSVSSSNFVFEDDDETAAIRSRVNEIGLRAKARLAQLEETFPELQIGSSLAARRAAGNSSSFYDAGEDDQSSSRSASKTVKITKRTVKTSYDIE
jgi:hypothetical protein